MIERSAEEKRKVTMDSYNINQMENRKGLQNQSHGIDLLVGGVKIGQSYLD